MSEGLGGYDIFLYRDVMMGCVGGYRWAIFKKRSFVLLISLELMFDDVKLTSSNITFSLRARSPKKNRRRIFTPSRF